MNDPFPEYQSLDALALSDLIARREISPDEVCKKALSLLQRLNPSLNAVISSIPDRVEERLRDVSLSGPLYGVPFLLKDLHHSMQGLAMSSGSRAMLGFVSQRDSELVSRWKQAGLVVLGKTNTPELGLVGTTEPELHGPTRNPWSLDHSPGGSSGGSAAAVSCRIAPMASAGDGGGSIRIPASCCGLFGLKPSRGRMPTGPEFGEIWEGAVADHVLSVTVRDSAAVLDATHGPDSGAPYLITPPGRPYLEESGQEPRALKIGFSTQSPVGGHVDPECRRAVDRTAALLSELGHQVEEVPLPYPGELVAECYLTMYFAQTAATLELMGQQRKRPVRRTEVETRTWALALQGRYLSSRNSCLSSYRWNNIARAMGRYHQDRDLLLTPVMATTPPRLGEVQLTGLEKSALDLAHSLGLGRLLSLTGTVRDKAMATLSQMPFTQVANISGQPAMSVPLHWTEDGLPCGVQFIAPLGDEATLFQLAGQLERARPWAGKTPPLLAG
jgi:amidase